MNKLKKIISSDISVVIGLLIAIGVISSLDGQYSLLSHKASPHPLLILAVILAAYRGLRFALISSVLINILYFSILFITIDSVQVALFLNLLNCLADGFVIGDVQLDRLDRNILRF